VRLVEALWWAKNFADETDLSLHVPSEGGCSLPTSSPACRNRAEPPPEWGCPPLPLAKFCYHDRIAPFSGSSQSEMSHQRGTPVPNMNGGCLCGDVRYSASGEPVVTSICHCRDCQRRTGSAFVEVVAVRRKPFRSRAGFKVSRIPGTVGASWTANSVPAADRRFLSKPKGFLGWL
jgi:hypothetical protein